MVAMTEEREVRPGWLPPNAAASSPAPPTHHAPGQQRPTFVRAKPRAEGPASPFALTAIVLSSISLLLVVISIGVGWYLSVPLSVLALGLAMLNRAQIRRGATYRESQARTAFVFSILALVFAFIAAAVWLGLESNGITPQDLQDWLERETERLRNPAPRDTAPRDTVEAFIAR